MAKKSAKKRHSPWGSATELDLATMAFGAYVRRGMASQKTLNWLNTFLREDMTLPALANQIREAEPGSEIYKPPGVRVVEAMSTVLTKLAPKYQEIETRIQPDGQHPFIERYQKLWNWLGTLSLQREFEVTSQVTEEIMTDFKLAGKDNRPVTD